MTPELFNRWRVVPRIALALFIYLVWHVSEWFMMLEAPTTEQSAFVALVVGVLPAVFHFYMASSGIKNKE